MANTVSFSCIQCNNTTGSDYLSGCDDYYLRKPYITNYSRCEACGLIQQSPMPTDVSSFYESYPIHHKKTLLHRIMRRWVMGACYFNTKKFLKIKKDATLVDFGCGDGWFLDANRDLNLKLIGFEVDKSHASHLHDVLKLPIYSEEENLLRDCEGGADFVTMHFVLEHVTDVNRSFEIIQKLLKPDGIFYFIIPNISSWESRFFGKKWHSLDAPRHISFPEASSIKQLADRWGFEIIENRGLPFPNGFAGSMPVVLTGNFRFSIFLLFLPIGIFLSRIFPNGTSAYWLKKKP